MNTYDFSGRVAVVGSSNMDLIATVERLPAPGESVPGRFDSCSGV